MHDRQCTAKIIKQRCSLLLWPSRLTKGVCSGKSGDPLTASSVRYQVFWRCETNLSKGKSCRVDHTTQSLQLPCVEVGRNHGHVSHELRLQRCNGRVGELEAKS